MGNVRKGRAAWVFGDHFDVDLIVGIKNVSTTDMNTLLAAVMQSYDPDFRGVVTSGDFLVAGFNFGYGHPHPQAMTVMRELGIHTIVSGSFAFPFFRSELASGMALITCPEAVGKISRWDEMKLDLEHEILVNETTGDRYRVDPVPPVAIEMIKAGGVVGYLKHVLRPGGAGHGGYGEL
jgi:3-isopropylmalate/(R)-2-methylmalate dehydratase small subunit